MTNRNLMRNLFAAVVGLFFMTGAWAQGAPYHMALVYDSEPAGPNETFYVRLVMQEHNIDISGYQLIVGWDSTRGTFNTITDNLGMGGMDADAVFTSGTDELALAGVSYADVYRKILLDTEANILSPIDANEDFDLGLLQFTSSADYNPADGRFGIYLAVDPAAGTYGVWDGMVDPIAVEFTSLDPGSAVADWAIY